MTVGDIPWILVAIFVVISLVLLVVVLRMRKRTKAAEADRRLDEGFEACMVEMNKMGKLIQEELESKYKEILFLYNLMEDKQKQIDDVFEKCEAMLAKVLSMSAESAGDVVNHVREKTVGQGAEVPLVHKPKPRPVPSRFLSDTHRKVWEMSECGREIPDIAKELGIGQGEVRFMLNVAAS